jgi:hypothetical protein
MRAMEQSLFLDKPETLETISLRTTVWKDKEGNEESYSFLWRYGCCLSEAFDDIHYETFRSRDKLIARFDTIFNDFRSRGFKTRSELGLIEIGECHDEQFLNYRKQLIALYLKALEEKCNIPPKQQ